MVKNCSPWIFSIIALIGLSFYLGRNHVSYHHPAALQPKLKNRALDVLLVGDSIVAGSPLWDPDSQIRASFAATDKRSSIAYWMRQIDQNNVIACGRWGARTDDIRMLGCMQDSRVIIGQGGINDIVQGLSADETIQNLRGLILDARAVKSRSIAIANIVAWPAGGPDANKEIRLRNTLIKQLAAKENIKLFDWWSASVNAQNKDTLTGTPDGNHPDIDGYRRIAAYTSKHL